MLTTVALQPTLLAPSLTACLLTTLPDRIIVYRDTNSPNPVPATTYTPDSFLQAFSTTAYDDMCLAHLFTHYDFTGILGLAWVGSVQGGAGVCDKQGRNTGFTTRLNYGSRVDAWLYV
jgi:hypothetical protein